MMRMSAGLPAYGIYAEIDDNHCEGMIPMRDLDDDYYEFDERNFCLVGRRHHNRYQLGDPVRILVAKADLEKRQLDFAMVGNGNREDRSRKASKPSSSKRASSKRSGRRR